LKSKKIYLIRHGQTDYNLQGIVQGSGVDSSLNSTGWQQARLFYHKYQALPFQKVYISALQRTYQSVAQFIEQGLPYEKSSALNEISWGEYDGKLDTKDQESIYWSILNRWKTGDLSAKVAGAENPMEVKERLLAFAAHLLDSPEHTILICMHGRAMRVLLSILMGKPLEEMDAFKHSNLCLYVLELEGDRVSIHQENDTSHLEVELPSGKKA
jgi:broad specificity phosphatase PhoE